VLCDPPSRYDRALDDATDGHDVPRRRHRDRLGHVSLESHWFHAKQSVLRRYADGAPTSTVLDGKMAKRA
jgi:hypothetical protein